MNGPVPSISLVGSKLPSLSSFIGRMAVMLAASDARSGVKGSFSSMATVFGSDTVMLLIEPIWLAHQEPNFGSTTRLMLPATSSAVIGRPFEKATPSRRWKTYLVGLGVSHDSARPGC